MNGELSSARGPARLAALLVCLLLVSSCRTAPQRQSGILSASTPEEALGTLTSLRQSFRGARAFVTIRPENGRRFDATVHVDREGRVLLSGLSPVGTTLFRLAGEGERLLVLQDRERVWWDGTFETFARETGLFRGMPIDSLSDLAMIFLGFPPADESLLEVTAVPTGLAAVSAADGSARVLYVPPVHPPLSVRIETRLSAIDVEIHEIVQDATPVEIPTPGAGWRCCELPRM